MITREVARLFASAGEYDVAVMGAGPGGIGAAAALADGPFPFGDAVGVVLAAGGTAWCLIDLKQICAQLPWELTAALHQDILEFHEACRRSVLP